MTAEVGSRESTHDSTRTDDTRIGAVRPLISPALLLDEQPIPEGALALVEQHAARYRRGAARARRPAGGDRRALLDPRPRPGPAVRAAAASAERERLGDELLLVMRVYFEKPRTTVGWKGYINDPRLDGSFHMNEGLRMARALLLDISALGLPAGTEFLDLLSPQYISDLIAWGAIGARTTESQSHRQLASGLSCPVGFKNGTDGGVKVAADAVLAARARHAFMGMTKMGQAAIFETRGNADCHVILRGGHRPNFDAASVAAACATLRSAGLREQVMIDFSHANSSKQYLRQIEVGHDVAQQIAAGNAAITGVMIESHLQEGRQDLQPDRGQRCLAARCVDHRRLPGLGADLAAAAVPGAGRAPAPRSGRRPAPVAGALVGPALTRVVVRALRLDEVLA